MVFVSCLGLFLPQSRISKSHFCVTMTRFYTSVRALRQRGYVCACLLYTYIYVCACIVWSCARMYVTCLLNRVVFLFGDRQIGWLRRTFDLWCVLAGSSSISAMGMTHQKRRRSSSIDNSSESAMEANAEVCLTENRNLLLSLLLPLFFLTLFSFFPNKYVWFRDIFPGEEDSNADY